MTTAFVYDALFLEHQPPAAHPESPKRAEAIFAQLERLGWLDGPDVLRLVPRPATEDELAAVHTREYIRSVEEAVLSGKRRLEAETYVSARSYEAALLAAGAPLVALDAMLAGRAQNGYALVRPPGHHARPAQAMGFCIFNNVAVAARYAIDCYKLKRVMIVDYDVHHGNGTQEIFYADPRVLYVSTHQYPWYPGTGRSDEMGEGEALGTTVNIPLPAGADWAVFDAIVRQVVAPLADRFRPELLLVSAGFDAHWRDPLGEFRLANVDFVVITRMLKELAEAYCQGRLLLVQEGGYDLEALAQAAASCFRVLLGGDEVVDTLGYAPQAAFRWNPDAIVGALRDLHGLVGYRRRPEKPQVRAGWETTRRPKVAQTPPAREETPPAADAARAGAEPGAAGPPAEAAPEEP
jgi:acetoin utilization deacetylase AcuC-like enzyme